VINAAASCAHLLSGRQRDELAVVSQRLRELGCDQVDLSAAVPLSGDEVSIPVSGPADVPVYSRLSSGPSGKSARFGLR
jgi:hypothetical protein